MDERLYWLWIAGLLGFAPAKLNTLLELYGSADDIWQNRNDENFRGLLTPNQRRQIDAKKPSDYEEVLNRHLDAGYEVIPYDSPYYPERLKAIEDPPAVLYADGDCTLLNEGIQIGMVGTRRPSAYGVEAARVLGTDLAKAGIVLVSGMADGLDSEAHKAAVSAGTPTIAVLGTAIDVTYPARNATLRSMIRQNGAVISEYPMGTAGQGRYFILRNRIIAGLSRGLVVVEARKRSGTMSTVRYALEDGRDIFAVPGSIFSPLSEGSNLLLQQGAKAVLSAADVLIEYGIEIAQQAEQPQQESTDGLSSEAKKLYEVLTSTPQTLQILCSQCGLDPGDAMAALTELEISGLSQQLAGRQFIRSR